MKTNDNITWGGITAAISGTVTPPHQPITGRKVYVNEGGAISPTGDKGAPIFENPFQVVVNSVADLLTYKNKKYGDSALNPIEIFNGKSKVGQRADDKLSRIKNSPELRKNDIVDLLGYLILMCVENGWDDFSEFKD